MSYYYDKSTVQSSRVAFWHDEVLVGTVVVTVLTVVCTLYNVTVFTLHCGVLSDLYDVTDCNTVFTVHSVLTSVQHPTRSSVLSLGPQHRVSGEKLPELFFI